MIRSTSGKITSKIQRPKPPRRPKKPGLKKIVFKPKKSDKAKVRFPKITEIVIKELKSPNMSAKPGIKSRPSRPVPYKKLTKSLTRLLKFTVKTKNIIGLGKCVVLSEKKGTKSICYSSSGKHFVGTLTKNKMEYGKIKNPDGTVFSGYFRDGAPHSGSVTLKNGIRIDAHQISKSKNQSNRLFGTKDYPEKSQRATALGFFNNKGQLDGKEEMTIEFRDGRVYKGLCNKGRLGVGRMDFKTGPREEIYFHGQFNANDTPRSGTKTWKSGGVVVRQYAGYFKAGKPHGKGTMVYEDGSIYQGNFVNGKPHGRGILQRKCGETFKDIWENGLEFKDTLLTIEGNWKNGHQFNKARLTVKEATPQNYMAFFTRKGDKIFYTRKRIGPKIKLIPKKQLKKKKKWVTPTFSY